MPRMKSATRDRYWPDQTDRNKGISQTEQPEKWVLTRPNRPKQGFGQTEQTETKVLARPNRPIQGYWPDRTDRNKGIGQTEQTELWVLARPTRPKYRYWPDRTDRNMGIRQTEQTKIAIGQTEGATQIFSRPLWTVAPDPPVRDPSRSGQYLSWVADFILGVLVHYPYQHFCKIYSIIFKNKNQLNH